MTARLLLIGAVVAAVALAALFVLTVLGVR
jgi:hypothetical protein